MREERNLPLAYTIASLPLIIPHLTSIFFFYSPCLPFLLFWSSFTFLFIFLPIFLIQSSFSSFSGFLPPFPLYHLSLALPRHISPFSSFFLSLSMFSCYSLSPTLVFLLFRLPIYFLLLSNLFIFIFVFFLPFPLLLPSSFFLTYYGLSLFLRFPSPFPFPPPAVFFPSSFSFHSSYTPFPSPNSHRFSPLFCLHLILFFSFFYSCSCSSFLLYFPSHSFSLPPASHLFSSSLLLLLSLWVRSTFFSSLSLSHQPASISSFISSFLPSPFCSSVTMAIFPFSSLPQSPFILSSSPFLISPCPPFSPLSRHIPLYFFLSSPHCPRLFPFASFP